MIDPAESIRGGRWITPDADYVAAWKDMLDAVQLRDWDACDAAMRTFQDAPRMIMREAIALTYVALAALVEDFFDSTPDASEILALAEEMHANLKDFISLSTPERVHKLLAAAVGHDAGIPDLQAVSVLALMLTLVGELADRGREEIEGVFDAAVADYDR